MRFFRLGLLLATVFNVYLYSAPQAVNTYTPPPETVPAHTLSGTVINSITSEPIRKALLTIQTGAGQHSTFSDASGHFEFLNITEGQISASCRKPGFRENNNLRFKSNGDHVVRLVPYSSITGRVTDEDGSPIEGALVQVITTTFDRGKPFPMQGQTELSDDDGHYEINNLAAGDYRLRLQTSNLPIFQRSSSESRQPRSAEMYAPLYAGGGVDLSTAQVFHLTPGQSQEADFSTKIVQSHRIAGVLSPASVFAGVTVEDLDGNDYSINTRVDGQTGRWIVNGIPSGTWRITVQGVGNGQTSFYAEQIIVVTDRDVLNVALAMTPLSQTPIAIRGANPNDDTDPVQVMFRRVTLTRQQQWSMLPGNKVQSVAAPPGRYMLQVQPTGSYCIEEARLGGTNVGREDVIIQPNSSGTPLTVSVRGDCAALDIELNKSDLPDTAVVLALGDNPLCQYTTSFTTNQSGNSRLEHMTPGTYRVYAFDTIEGLEYANENVMQSFASASVTLTGNASSSVKLDMNRRGSGREEAP